MFDTLQVPVFPRVSDYVGAWAIDPQAGSALLAAVQGIDLAAHVAASQPKPTAAVEMLTAGLNQTIAVVSLAGTLMKSQSSMGSSTSTVAARREIRKAAADPEVSAILLAIDSPGGSVAGTADLANEIAAANKKKPVWAYAADLCASAAYWCASQAERIYANDATALVGSIGTLLVVQDTSAAAEKNGIKTLVFGTGPLKGSGSPGAPVSEGQQAYYRKIVDESQKAFDASVRRGRGLTESKLAQVKTGGVFLAEEAQSYGLIDGIKSMDVVMNELAAEARRRKRSASSQRAETPQQPIRSKAVNETNEVMEVAAAPAQVESLVESVVKDTVSAIREAAVAETNRVAAIQSVCKGHEAIAAQAIAEGWTPEKAELAAMKASLPKGVAAFTQGSVPNVIVRDRERDCSRDVLQGAMILRAGLPLDHKNYTKGIGTLPQWLRASINDAYRNEVMENAHRLCEMSAVDLCREALRIDGRDIPASRSEMIQAAVSGGTLTNIFTTSVNAGVLMSYMDAGDTTVGWTREAEVADFKTNERIRMKAVSGLSKLPRGNTADHLNRSDTAESYKIGRYAGQFKIDEQDIIDDSLNALSDTPMEMGKLAARLRPDLVYAILLANPTMADTVALFSSAATRGNLGSSSSLTAANLKTGISAMRLLQENGVNIGLKATHLLLPASLDWTGRELVNSTAITSGNTSGQGNINTLQNVVEVISDERLENGVIDPNSGTTYSGSATTWFLASMQANTIEVGFLRGSGKAPTVRSFTLDKGSYGIGWDVCLDIGAKAMDWRGLRKTTA